MEWVLLSFFAWIVSLALARQESMAWRVSIGMLSLRDTAAVLPNEVMSQIIHHSARKRNVEVRCDGMLCCFSERVCLNFFFVRPLTRICQFGSFFEVSDRPLLFLWLSMHGAGLRCYVATKLAFSLRGQSLKNINMLMETVQRHYHLSLQSLVFEWWWVADLVCLMLIGRKKALFDS